MEHLDSQIVMRKSEIQLYETETLGTLRKLFPRPIYWKITQKQRFVLQMSQFE